jgi:hypothetical protein
LSFALWESRIPALIQFLVRAFVHVEQSGDLGLGEQAASTASQRTQQPELLFCS